MLSFLMEIHGPHHSFTQGKLRTAVERAVRDAKAAKAELDQAKALARKLKKALAAEAKKVQKARKAVARAEAEQHTERARIIDQRATAAELRFKGTHEPTLGTDLAWVASVCYMTIAILGSRAATWFT